MFAVVEDQQQGFTFQVVEQRLLERLSGLFSDAQRFGDRGDQESRLGQRSQFQQPHAVGIGFQHLRRHL